MLIVIVIIGILAAALMPRLTGVRQRAQDVAVKADIKTISSALELHHMDFGTYKIEGAGHTGNGWGWVTFEGEVDPSGYVVNYPKSIINALAEKGYMSGELKASGKKRHTGWIDYLLYLCNNAQEYAISGKLHYPTEADIAHIQTTCNGSIDYQYGSYNFYDMNYAIGGGRQ